MSFLTNCNLSWKKSKEESFIHHLKFANQRREAIAHFELNVKKANPYKNNAKLDENLCWAIREVEREKHLKDRMSRKHFEENDDIRTLIQKLRHSYIQRSNEAQIQENLVRRNSETARLNDNIEFINSCVDAPELKELEKKQRIREELMKEQERSKQEVCWRKKKRHEQFLEEQRQLRQYEENLKETIAKEKAQEKEKKLIRARDMDLFLKSREAIVLSRKLEEEEYDRSIEKQIIIKDEESKRRKEEQERVLLRRAEISQSIGLANLERETKRIQKRDELEALIVLEKENRDEEKLEELKVKHVQKVIRTKHLNDFYLKEKLEKVEAQRAQVMMEKYSQMKELERVKNELDKEKEEQHEFSIKFALDNHEKRQSDHKNFALLQTHKQMKRAEELAALQREQNVIEEERINILKQHYKHLVGYMPPGVLRESDREYLISL
ncbi:MNS1 family protein [Megaselia abdita]